MILDQDSFMKEITESELKKIHKSFGSFGDYVEDLYNQIENKEEFQRIVSKFFRLKNSGFKKDNFKEGDVVLIEYWYKNILTPVLIKKKIKRKFKVSHNISQSQIQNAPDEVIKKQDIVDFYFDKHSKNLDVNLSIKNSVNSMNQKNQISLIKSIHHYYGNPKNENNYNYNSNSDLLNQLGKIGFNSFVKILSALNIPEIDVSENYIPKDFLFFVRTGFINKTKFLRILKRFRSMEEVFKIVEKTSQTIECFYGPINYKGRIHMSYGIILGDTLYQIGSYVLNNKKFEELRGSNQKPLKPLTKNLERVDIYTLKNINKIKNKLHSFDPGYYVSKNPINIKNGILQVSYYGWGEWDHGTIKTRSVNSLKNNFKDWAQKENLKNRFKFKIQCEDFWTTILIKIK